MGLRLGLQNGILLSSHHRITSLGGNVQGEKLLTPFFGSKVGATDDSTAVLDKDFRVRGTTNLRVVDASVFPYIPGFFIVTPVYMIAEKAPRRTGELALQSARGAERRLAARAEG